MANSWTDRIVGDRMTVDKEFQSRIQQSEFSSQQWGLIMTAVEFEIENPTSESDARIVADTSSLPHIMDELDNIEQGMNAMGGGQSRSGSGGGLFSGLLDAIGLGGGGSSQAQLEAAESLTQEYAETLQSHLEEQGKWDRVRRTAAEN